MAEKLHSRQLRMDGFFIHVTQKRIRNFYLRLGEEPGDLRVSVPYGTRDKEILSFVSSKRQWIENHKNRQKKQEKPAILSLEEGSPVYIWGECLHLHFEKGKNTGAISVSGSALLFPLDQDSGQDVKRLLLYNWLAEILGTELRIFVEKWSGLLKLFPRRVVIREMKTRWGSCTPALGSIRINFFLVHLEKIFLDYVVLHEFVHFLEPSHNARFYSLMDQWMPDWQDIRKRLKRNGLQHRIEADF